MNWHAGSCYLATGCEAADAPIAARPGKHAWGIHRAHTHAAGCLSAKPPVAFAGVVRQCVSGAGASIPSTFALVSIALLEIASNFAALLRYPVKA